MRTLVGCLLIAAATAACGGPDTGSPTDPDAPSPADAPSPTSLRVKWNSMPPIPGSIMNDLNVATATFHLARLQIVGDGGSAGATTLNDFDLTWDDQSPTPRDIVFEGAPLGLYSTIALGVEGEVARNSFEITGTVKIGATFEPYRIYDTEPLDIEIHGYEVELEPGTTKTMPVKLDIKNTLRGVEYDALPLVGGVRTLEPTDPQIAWVRNGLTAAFAHQ